MVPGGGGWDEKDKAFVTEEELTMKRKATLADAVLCASWPPLSWKLSMMTTSIMERVTPIRPHIMGFRLPNRSRQKVGNIEPIMNMALMTPPRMSDRFRSKPTLVCKIDVA